jgi:AcrR family transcriptional regulator
MTRTYRQAKRAEAQEGTREKIVRATMALHLERGVATTSYSDVAERSGVGAATVYRHFPTMGSLVEACGAHFWQMIAPPGPERAAAIFAEHSSRPVRIEMLVRELDAFYARGTAPLVSAVRDHDRVAELALFLKEVRSAVAGLVAVALDEEPQTTPVKIVAAVADFTVWLALSGTGVAREERIRLMVAMIDAAISLDKSGAGKSWREGG